MKSGILLIITIVFLQFQAICQTIIATSQCSTATANHNQRKIVRGSNENVYIVYQDISNDTNIINWITYKKIENIWESPVKLFNGKNPSIAISIDNKLHLVYESNDSLSSIMYASKSTVGNWSTPIVISDSNNVNIIPVVDLDSASTVHIVWIEKNTNNDKVKYLNITGDTIGDVKVLYTDTIISDVTIATNLQYADNDIFVAYSLETTNKIHFLYSKDNGENWNIFDNYTGSYPCISVGFHPYPFEDEYNYSQPKLLYLDSDKNAVLIEYCDTSSLSTDYIQEDSVSSIVVNTPVSNIYIDDAVLPSFGFGFLYIQNGILFQAFYSSVFSYVNLDIIDSITDSPIYPSIAYKQFRMALVDYIWMENNGSEYEIYYNQSNKMLLAVEPEDNVNEEPLTAYPNPFSSNITISISLKNSNIQHDVWIFNTEGKPIKKLKCNSKKKNLVYTYEWDGKDSHGNIMPAGSYIVRTICDKKIINRIILFIH